MSTLVFRRPSRCSKGGCAEVALTPEGDVVLRCTRRPGETVTFDAAEWADLRAALVAGEFG